MVKIPNRKSIFEMMPKLEKEWHLIKNGKLSPLDFSYGSDKKVWWKCSKGNDHEWLASIYNRTNGTGCPVCSGKKIVKSNCLYNLNPSLAREWHPTKNKELTPKEVGIGYSKKVWWKCGKGNDHEWMTSVVKRSRGNGCPICKNKKVVVSNSLAILNPKLALEWHPIKNINLKPLDFAIGSGKKIWWKCPKGDDHEWQASIVKRTSGQNCPFCSGKKMSILSSLAVTFPKLANEWHPTKNNNLVPENVYHGSELMVWWKCPKGDDHEWQALVSNRTRLNVGCSICAGKKIVHSNSMATLKPELIKQWHPSKNGTLSPSDFSISSGKVVWWKCPEGDDHEWQALVSNRTKLNGSSCPICSGNIITISNCLATLDTEKAKYWHPILNKKLTPFDVGVSSATKAWWKCPKGEDHIWSTRIANKKGCPFCTLTPQSRQELTITFELKQFFNINPKGFKLKIDGKLFSIDIYLEELNIGIEFDGSYWHKDKNDLDKLKTNNLKREGFEIIRIREEPLKAITEIDIVSKLPFDPKKVTNDILKYIVKEFQISNHKLEQINNYLRKPNIQNESALNDYIETILQEKAVIKNNKYKHEKKE